MLVVVFDVNTKGRLSMGLRLLVDRSKYWRLRITWRKLNLTIHKIDRHGSLMQQLLN